MCKVVIHCRRKRKRKRVFLVPGVRDLGEQAGPVQTSWQHAGKRRGRKVMALTMTDSQQCTLTVAFLDKKGNPAPTDGPPEWLVDNPNVLTLTPAPDGLSCLVVAVGPLGSAVVSVKADADLGSGVVEIVGTLDVTITGGTATTVTITPGTPAEQP